jgi:hypothetical protein
MERVQGRNLFHERVDGLRGGIRRGKGSGKLLAELGKLLLILYIGKRCVQARTIALELGLEGLDVSHRLTIAPLIALA